MRSRTIITVVLLALCATALATAQTASDLYRQGLAREQVGDCEGAIPVYERIVHEFPANKDREQVASAKLHLGECWIKRTESDQVKGLDYLNDVTTHYKDLPDITQEADRIKRLMPPVADPGKPLVIATPFTEDVFSFAISPDGRNLVLQATTEDGKRQLWLQPVDASKKPTAIAGTEGAGRFALPFFSPNGQSIGFFAGGKLKRVLVSGGIPQDLADLPIFLGGTWNKDGIIVYSDGKVLRRIQDEDGSGKMDVTSTVNYSQTFPKFLSDGFRFLFAVNPGPILSLGAIDHRARSGIQPVDAEAAVFAPPDRMVFVAGGALMAQRLDDRNENLIGDSIGLAPRVAVNRSWPGIAALSVSDAGPIAFRTEAFPKRQFRFVDRKGNLIRSLGLVDALNPSSARISRDGKTVTFHRENGNLTLGSMWMMDAEMGTPSQLRNLATSAVWSPNTEHMMFAEQESKGVQVDLIDRMGIFMEPRHVVTVGAILRVDDWSSKNDIVYERSQGGTLPADLLALRFSGGDPVVIAGNPAASERNGRFSPEGDWVAYQSNELESRDEVFVQRFPGSTDSRKQVSIKGGTFPHWSSDGLQLYFKSADNHLMSVPMTRSAVGEDIVPGQAVPLFSLKPGSEFEVAADDRFLINAPTEDASPIMVLSNWANKIPAATANSISSPLVKSAPAGRPTGYGTQTQIVVYDRQQHVLGTVDDTGLTPKVTISPDGTRVAYPRGGDIKVVEIATGIGTLIASNTANSPASWSPDGSRISYLATRNGIQGVYVKASNGTGSEERLYEPATNVFNWSKDGRFLAVQIENDFAVLPIDGDRKPILVTSASGRKGLRLAPEGRLAAYVSNESGSDEAYVQSFNPASGTASSSIAAAKKISTQGSPGPIRWNSDGKEMYYLASDGNVMAVSVASATAFGEQSPAVLFRVPDNFPLAGAPGAYSDVSADGQRFVFALPVPTATQQ